MYRMRYISLRSLEIGAQAWASDATHKNYHSIVHSSPQSASQASGGSSRTARMRSMEASSPGPAGARSVSVPVTKRASRPRRKASVA